MTFEELIAENPDLPSDTLMLGMANDGLPILLNLYEPTPGPVLVVGDSGVGKTSLMQTLAQATNLIQDPSDIQFGVVSSHPDEWQVLDVSPGSLGVWPATHPSAQDFIQRISDWARQPEHGRQVIVLFLDDLASIINNSFDVQENIKWLLLNGSKNQVWIVASLNVLRAIRMRVWLDLFNTHIFGYIQQPSLARSLTTDSISSFDSLVPGLEFDIKQQGEWLRFWLPAIKTC
jgi:energy-coupling factor transporter ATP-binding protein EcfA2